VLQIRGSLFDRRLFVIRCIRIVLLGVLARMGHVERSFEESNGTMRAS
jgi:hypothetical protein